MKKAKHISFYIITSILLILAALGASSLILRQQPNRGQPVKYYGHRGYKGEYPENTMPAFKGAMEAGFDGIEFDIYETNSGDILVHHDDTTDRMCKIQDSIYNVSAENRENYPIVTGNHIEKYGTLVMPTFEETVAEIADKKGGLYINLKGLDHITDAGIDKIKNILEKYDITGKSVVFCGRIELLKKFEAKGMNIGFLSTKKSKKAVMEHLNACIASTVKTFIVFNPKKITQKMVDLSHENGMKIGVYKVQTKEEQEKLLNLGVDFMFSDYTLFR